MLDLLLMSRELLIPQSDLGTRACLEINDKVQRKSESEATFPDRVPLVSIAVTVPSIVNGVRVRRDDGHHKQFQPFAQVCLDRCASYASLH